MRAIIINKSLSLLKACIFSGLAFLCLIANAEDTPEYAAVPPVDGCHYAEHPIIRETVHYKYRRVTYHHVRVHHKLRYSNGLAVYYPYDNGWPSNGCYCEQNGYYVLLASSDDITYNLMYYGPLYENRAVATDCE